MYIRISLIFFIALAFAIKGTCLRAEILAVNTYNKRATNLSKKQFKHKIWTNNQKSDLMQKSFAFKQWDSHYSSLGSKKSSIIVKESKDKKHFKTNLVKFSTKKKKVSKWNGRIADLERQAQISTNVTLKKIEEKRIYYMMMQKSEHYKETGKKLLLRDINRFQFRRNRSNAAVPVQTAGEGEGF